jgi:hypothetical protein
MFYRSSAFTGQNFALCFQMLPAEYCKRKSNEKLETSYFGVDCDTHTTAGFPFGIRARLKGLGRYKPFGHRGLRRAAYCGP